MYDLLEFRTYVAFRHFFVSSLLLCVFIIITLRVACVKYLYIFAMSRVRFRVCGLSYFYFCCDIGLVECKVEWYTLLSVFFFLGGLLWRVVGR